MDLESSKKVLRISGFLTIVGAILSVASGAMGLVLGKAAEQMPEVVGNPDYQQGAKALLNSGLAEIIAGVLSLFEGGCTISAGKTGKYAGAAFVFASIGFTGSILGALSMVLKHEITTTKVISFVLAIILNAIIFVAAGKVRKANKQ